MNLVYLDESGNTGNNLNDPQQPIFSLCAMVVKESKWQALEKDLESMLDLKFPDWRKNPNFEIHGLDIRNGMGQFKGVSVEDRVKFRDSWMGLAFKHEVKLIHRSVDKKMYAKWQIDNLGSGVQINPHVAAFALVACYVEEYLKSLPDNQLGTFISDDNKQISGDVEKSIRVLRGNKDGMRLTRIIEKGFFIDSRKSLPLQLCDTFSLAVRKRMEKKRKYVTKTIDDGPMELVEKLSYANAGSDNEIIEWLTKQYSAGA